MTRSPFVSSLLLIALLGCASGSGKGGSTATGASSSTTNPAASSSGTAQQTGSIPATQVPASTSATEAAPYKFLDWRYDFSESGGVTQRYLEVENEAERARFRELADTYEGLKRPWRMSIFIYKSIDVTWTDRAGATKTTKDALTPAQIQMLQDAITRLLEDIRAYSQGRLDVKPEIHVLEQPLTKLHAVGEGPTIQYDAWVEATEADLAPYVKEGEVDSVVVYWPASDIECGGIFGTGGLGGMGGTGYSEIHVFNHNTDFDTVLYAEATLHEWLHQIEAAREGVMGRKGLPVIHDAGLQGWEYKQQHQEWMSFYRDFMDLYLSPQTWEELTVRASPTASASQAFVRGAAIAGPFARVAGSPRLPAGDEGAAAWSYGTADAGGVFNFDETYPGVNDSAIWVQSWVHAPFATTLTMETGSDDGLVVFVNQREVYRKLEPRAYMEGADKFDVKLAAGWNRLFIVVDQGGGGWKLSARFTRLGSPANDLVLSAALPEGSVPASADESNAPKPELKTFNWELVRQDPWNKLPSLAVADLQALLSQPTLALLDNDKEVLIADDKSSRRDLTAQSKLTFDNGLFYGKESMAALPITIDGKPQHVILMRPEVADILAVKGKRPVTERLVGYVSLPHRVVLVGLAELDGVASERDLLP